MCIRRTCCKPVTIAVAVADIGTAPLLGGAIDCRWWRPWPSRGPGYRCQAMARYINNNREAAVQLCLAMIILSVTSATSRRTIKSMKRIHKFHRGMKPGSKKGSFVITL